MGDFENQRVIAPARKPTLKEAVSKVINSFDTSPLNAKFEMTIQDGYNIQKALNRINRALHQLEENVGIFLHD